MNFGRIDSIILFGGGEFLSRFALKLLKEKSKFLVVSSRRHLKEDITINSETLNLKQFLTKNKIDYHTSGDVNNDELLIDKILPNTLGISMGAAWIFTGLFIKRFNGKLVNVHGTRLPQNRGGGGFSWQILRNNRLGFSLIHRVEPGIDTGTIIKYREFFYPASCRIPSEYRECYVKNSYILLEGFLEDIKNEKDFKCIEQQEYFSTYWPRLSTDIHGFVDWSWPLKDIELFICAFDDPYKGASSFINDKRVFLKDCFSDINDGVFHPFQKGIVYRKSGHALYIATEDGTLIVKKIEDENKKDLFNKIDVGDRFYTPNKFLERAKQYRALYTAEGLKK